MKYKMALKSEGPEHSRKRKSYMRFELADSQLEEIKEAFNIFDTEGKGFLPVKELKIAIRALGFEPRKDEIHKLLKEIDKENADTINLVDFCDIIMIKMAEKGTKDEISRAFRLFDDDETGKISFKNLKRVAEELGERLTDEELQAMLDEADQDGDGEINEQEFFRIMEKTNLY